MFHPEIINSKRCIGLEISHIEDDDILFDVHGWHLLLPDLQCPVVACPHLGEVVGHGGVRGGGW